MIQLYTIDGCSRSHFVKHRLQQLGISFIEKNLFEYPCYIEELRSLTREFVLPTLIYETRVFSGKLLWDKLESMK
ncbi:MULTISPECIES: hypothetical protein [unclassified Exiguobacterium]|uniref:hypothetical protein n=1 Tax=unclassified Exiguobacterium TaxID=2644629 RepID=UPI001BEA562A|nr:MULTISPECIES: hypothetical protein [unclassified Exiguobacterium]